MATISASGVVTPALPGDTGLRGLRGLMGEEGELSWHTNRSFFEVQEEAEEEPEVRGARGEGLRVWASRGRGHRLRLCRAGSGEAAERAADGRGGGTAGLRLRWRRWWARLPERVPGLGLREELGASSTSVLSSSELSSELSEWGAGAGAGGLTTGS